MLLGFKIVYLLLNGDPTQLLLLRLNLSDLNELWWWYSHKAIKFRPWDSLQLIHFLETESRAITRYVSKKQQGKGSDLLGSTLAEQAMVDVWCEVEAHQFSVPSSAIVVQCVIIPMREGKTDEEVVKTNMEKLNKVLDVYEERLAKHNYLAGDFFSLADLHHLSYIHYLVHVAGKGEIISSRPHVNAWWQRISARPAWQKVTQIMKW